MKAEIKKKLLAPFPKEYVKPFFSESLPTKWEKNIKIEKTIKNISIPVILIIF